MIKFLKSMGASLAVFASAQAVAAMSISTPTVTNIQADTALISWVTGQASTSKVEYGLDSALSVGVTQTKFDSARVFNHQIQLSGLEPGKQYYYRVSSTNTKRNNFAASGILSFQTVGTVTAFPPTTLTISSIVVSNIQSSSANISWATNLSATSKIVYSRNSSLPADSLIKYDGTFQSTRAFSLTGLDAGATYYYRLSSADSVGGYAETGILSFNTAAAAAPALAPAPAPTSYNIPMTSPEWKIAYDGYGFVTFDAATGSVVFAPMVADPNGPVVDIGNTHAVMLLANRLLAQPLRNLKITVVVTTEQQLRTPVPNAWECFWLFFNYTVDAAGKKQANYFTLKPNGFELGTAFDEVGQKFLATGTSPVLAVGAKNTFVIEKKDTFVKAYVNGVLVMSFSNATSVNPIYDQAGTIGLYSEDARVRVHSVQVEPL